MEQTAGSRRVRVSASKAGIAVLAGVMLLLALPIAAHIAADRLPIAPPPAGRTPPEAGGASGTLRALPAGVPGRPAATAGDIAPLARARGAAHAPSA